MDLKGFSPLPDDAQLWIYGFQEPLKKSDKTLIGHTLEELVRGWVSHEMPVTAAFTVVFDRFVMIAAFSANGISGCSIDSSVRPFKYFRDVHHLNALDRSLIFYRDGESVIQSSPCLRFQQLVDSAVIGPRTPVFDTTLRSLGEVRKGGFELPFESSWHARSFPRSEKGRGLVDA
ncbi:MAG: hypothetical protein ACE5JX_16700 [Acidobacteriota bacterium]